MAEIRINGLTNTAQTASNDDYVVLDGATNGTRKMLAKKLTEGVEQQLATTNQNVAQNTEDITDLKADLSDGTLRLYTDLSTWLNAYNDSIGQPYASAKNITPNSAPVKLDNGESVNVDCGSMVCSLAIYRYDADHYVRTSVTDHTGKFDFTSNSDNYYYAISFKKDPLVNITPTDFDGRISTDLEWKKQIDDNTDRIDDLPDSNGLVFAYTDLTGWTQGYFGANGTINSSSWKITPLSAPLKMLPNDVIVIDPTPLVATINLYNLVNGSYARQSSTTISELTEITYDQTKYISFDFGKSPAGATSPSDFKGYIKAPSEWKAQINSNTDRIITLENAVSGGDNVLFGKKLVACGDSITAAVNPNGGNFNSYAKLTADRNGMEFAINAVSGSTMTNVEGKSPFCVDRYQNIPSDFDYLTIWFGYNDGAYAQLGTIEDTSDTTFYGAYKKVLDYLLTTYPTKKIGLVVPYMNNSAFQQAVRDISEMYGVPCLDLPDYNQCSIVWGSENTAQTARKNALTYDGTHPNQTGHEFISTMYDHFLRKL